VAFQECVPKRSELRVTIIGDDIFVAELLSQDHARTQYDWRHYDVQTPMRAATLPAEMVDRCFALVRGYGLNFGALDFILTPDDRYVFLEINPNGQWMWVQDKVPELRMKEAMAACLIRAKRWPD
jgi:glutathione synthase/RimK-type ligase-like ATP-grasp enzyme